MRGPVALANPAVLAWARETAGFTIDQAAKKAQVKPEHLHAWERRDARPSVPQLRRLAAAYKRPLAVFYLPAPPREFSTLRDFRRLPGRVAGLQSPELRRAIRQAHLRRDVALELTDRLQGEMPEFVGRASSERPPEALAEELRGWLGVAYEEQVRWTSDYQALNRWRSACEALGLLALQAVDVDLNEARGFSIGETPVPVLVVNISDSVVARIFTLLHELTHVALHEGGLCDLDERHARPPEELRLEVYCNHVAGAIIIPARHLLAEASVIRQGNRKEWDEEVLSWLARRYRASREVVLRRLLILGRTTMEFYAAKRKQYHREYLQREEERRGQEHEGFAPQYQIALSAAGPTFTSLVMAAYNRELITSSDVSDYLDVRVKHIDAAQRAAVAGTR